MGLILHGLDGSITFDSSVVADATLGATVAISPSPPAPLLLDIDILAEVGQQYQPRGQVVQRPYMRLEIENFTPLSSIEMKDFTGPFSIERTLDQGTQWSMQIAVGAEQPGVLSLADRAATKMPVELEIKAPPPALAEINVYGGYWLTDGTAFEQLLMSDGIAASSNRKYNLEGHVMDIQGIGPEGRWDRALASLNLPPDHGYTHGDIIDALAVYVGIPLQQLAIAGVGSPRFKPLDVCRENWWSLARDIAEAAVLVPYWDRSGVLTLGSLFGDQDSLPQFVFTELDIMSKTGIDIQSDADVPTCVTVQGTKKADLDSDGLITKATFVESFQDFAIPRASHVQSSAGVVSSRGVNSPTPTWQLVSRTSVLDEIKNECLVVRNTIVEGYYNPQHWKWAQDTAGVPKVSGFNDDGFLYLEDSGDDLVAPTDGDSTPLRQWSNFKWVEISGERLSFPRWTEDSGIYGVGTGPVGYKEAELTAKRGWFIPEHAVKTRTGSSTTWEDTNFIDNQRMIADGRAVGGTVGYRDREHYQGGPLYRSRFLSFALTGVAPPKIFHVPQLAQPNGDDWLDTEVTRYVVDICGFILRESHYASVPGVDLGYSASGDQYLFKGGEVGGNEQFGRRVEGSETDYVSIGEQSHRAIATKYEDGQIIEIVVTDSDGHLPAADACGLDRTDNIQDIEAKVCALEEVHEQYEDTLQNDFVESIEEARSLATALLRDSQAVRISFTLSAVWAMEPGMLVQIYMPRARISHECILERVRFYRSEPGGPILTAAVGKILVS